MTSKKCISMGLLLKNGAGRNKLDKSPSPLQMHHHHHSSKPVPPPMNNGFMPMLPMMPFPPFYNPMTALNPSAAAFSIQKLLEHSAAMDSLLKSTQNNNNVTKSPGLNSNPEDMIEEVNEPEEEPRLMIDEDNKVERHSPSPPRFKSILDRMSEQLMQIRSKEAEARDRSRSPMRSEATLIKQEKTEVLQCGRCPRAFHHPTELAQHELVCHSSNGSILDPPNGIPFTSGSETENDDRESKTSSESERKVRVRTAISEEQQQVLKEHYAVNSRPSRDDFKLIAHRLALDARVVQVWFQNNRSRERKLSNLSLLKPGMGPHTPPHYNTPQASAPPPPPQTTPPQQTASAAAGASETDQPLDLSVKKDEKMPSNSPRYGAADEIINLSHQLAASQSSPFPYGNFHPDLMQQMRHIPSPNEAATRQSRLPPYLMQNPSGLGLVPMERLFPFSPDMTPAMLGLKAADRSSSISPGSSEKRSWKDDDSRVSYDDEPGHLPKRLYASSDIKDPPNADGMYVCTLCDKAFHKQSSLARHKYEHSGEFLFFSFPFTLSL